MFFLIHAMKTYREIHGYSAITCVYSRIAARH